MTRAMHVNLRWFALLLAVFCTVATALAAKPHERREIKTGAYITSISGINAADGSYRIAGYLWFVDPAGLFDPNQSIEIFARNASHELMARIELDGGGVYTALAFNAVVDADFNLHDYPYDRQTLSLIIETTKDLTDLIFVADMHDSAIAATVNAPGWTLSNLRLMTSAKTYTTGFGYRKELPAFSRVTLHIDAQHNVSALIFEKFTGYLVALIITALVFLVPAAELGTRVSMLTSSIFAAVFNRYRLEDSLGFNHVFGLVDQVSLITFAAILSALAFSLYAHQLCQRRTAADVAVLNRRVGLSMALFFTAMLAWAFLRALP
jgi:hypothetical protein